VRRLLFRCPGECTGPHINHFTHKLEASAEVRQLILSATKISSGFAPTMSLSTRSSSNSSMACSESSSVESEESAAAEGVEPQVVVTAAVGVCEGGKGLVGGPQIKVQLSLDAGRVVVAAH
jgi:hypothetical protein